MQDKESNGSTKLKRLRDVLDAIWRGCGNPEAGEPWPGRAPAILTAIKEVGMVILPREPSPAMLNAAIDAHGHKLGCIAPLGFRMSPQRMFEESYRAMITAGEE